VVDGFEIGGHFSTNQQRNVVQNGFEPMDIDRTSWSLRIYLDDILKLGLYAQTEYISLRADDESWEMVTNSDNKYRLSGFYTEAGYRITQNWQLLDRYDEMDEKPIQSLANAADSLSNQYTSGVTRFIHE
jgi:hypothetical protein